MASKREGKHLMERRRRARINESLSHLKLLVVGEVQRKHVRLSKMDKADILEMAVEYVKKTREQAEKSGPSGVTVDRYRAGFNACADVLQSHLDQLPQISNDCRARLMDHLANFIQNKQWFAQHMKNACLPLQFCDPTASSTSGAATLPGSSGGASGSSSAAVHSSSTSSAASTFADLSIAVDAVAAQSTGSASPALSTSSLQSTDRLHLVPDTSPVPPSLVPPPPVMFPSASAVPVIPVVTPSAGLIAVPVSKVTLKPAAHVSGTPRSANTSCTITRATQSQSKDSQNSQRASQHAEQPIDLSKPRDYMVNPEVHGDVTSSLKRERPDSEEPPVKRVRLAINDNKVNSGDSSQRKLPKTEPVTNQPAISHQDKENNAHIIYQQQQIQQLLLQQQQQQQLIQQQQQQQLQPQQHVAAYQGGNLHPDDPMWRPW